MHIKIQKASRFECAYHITRDDQTTEHTRLETKTYLLHDFCHYAVERTLNYRNGFWGLLAQGFNFEDLRDKENPQTKPLRSIEHIVGPVQSVYWGHISRQDFPKYIAYTGIPMPEEVLDTCLAEIDNLMQDWELLAVGEQMELEWKLQV